MVSAHNGQVFVWVTSPILSERAVDRNPAIQQIAYPRYDLATTRPWPAVQVIRRPKLQPLPGRFGAAHKEIDQRAHERQEDYHDYPHNLLHVRDALVRNGVDQHPEPEREAREADGCRYQEGEHPEYARSDHSKHRI